MRCWELGKVLRLGNAAWVVLWHEYRHGRAFCDAPTPAHARGSFRLEMELLYPRV